jgi:hypothetical protein
MAFWRTPRSTRRSICFDLREKIRVNALSLLHRTVRSSLLACLACAIALVCVVPAQAAPSPEDQQAVERGRVMGRALVWFRAPSMCVIATLRARCTSDFATFVDKRTDDSFAHLTHGGPTPLTRMRRYLAAGDPDDFEPAFISIYGLIAPTGMRAASPLGAWLYDAGIVDETFPGSVQQLGMQQMSRGTLIDMILHIRDAGAYASLFPAGSIEKLGAVNATTPLPPEFITDISAHLPENIDKTFPADPIPRLPDPADPVKADVAFGLALGTMQELAEVPIALALPESQAFLDDWVVRAKRYAKTPADAKVIADTRDGLRMRYPIDADVISAAAKGHAGELNAMLGSEHDRRASLAVNAMQVAFNASYVRSAANAAVYTEIVGKLSDADSAFPELAKRRAAIAALKSTDFAGQFRLATSMVDYLMAGMAR